MTATGTVHFGNAHSMPTDQGELGPISAPFTKVPTAIVRGHALGLSPWAKLLYVALCSYADPAGACYPGYTTLRADVGCGLNQLTRAMRELEAAGLITRRRRGQGHSSRYTLYAPATAPAAPLLIPSGSESRVTPRGKLESRVGGAEQDSGDQDPGEHQQSMPRAPLAPTASDTGGATGADDDVLVSALIEHGVTRRVAQGLVTSHSPKTIRQQLEWLPHRSPAKNPAGQLVLAIREEWPEPPDVAAAQQRAAVAARQAEEAHQREVEALARQRAWAAKPPEERIAGRLTFWIQGRRAKRYEPTAAEIAARRAELLAELAGAGAPAPGTG